MNITENERAITTVTVSRTHSLRDHPRQFPRDEQNAIDNPILIKNQRSFSNDKISTDCKTPLYNHQRGSSLRQNGKSAFPISSPISNNHHSFQIIKPIETSPRTSESIIDPDFGKNSQKFKFKSRSNNTLQGGPLIPDHSLKMDSQKDGKIFTPRPPLSKRFSSDQEDAGSDIDSNQSVKNQRSYSIQNQKASVSKPLRSPNRTTSQNLKEPDYNCQDSIEKSEKYIDVNDEYINGLEDNIHSDCEIPPSQPFGANRSSLRKGSDSPNHSDTQTRNSPSPTKTVKWNPNLLVKNIPTRLKSKNKTGKSKSIKNDSNNSIKTLESELQSTVHINLELVESHESYISHCTTLIRNQMSLLEKFREDKISLSTYQKDLIEQIEFQRKLISDFHSVLTADASACDKSARFSDF